MSNALSTIMIVDDNLPNLAASKNVLKPYFQVTPVPSAGAMFETLEHVLPDLILLDIDMPDIDGYEALQRLKADSRYAGIPVIILTALDGSEDDMEKSAGLGAAGFIKKPFSATGLIEYIEEVLPSSGNT